MQSIVLIQIFEGHKFRCFHGQTIIHQIFILKISLVFMVKQIPVEGYIKKSQAIL